MDTTERRSRAAGLLSWAAEAAAQEAHRGYEAGAARGLAVGLALAALDPAWASAALDELVREQHVRLATTLAGTPMPPPELEMHRLAIFAQAQDVIRRGQAAS